jgi:hypothetical protein
VLFQPFSILVFVGNLEMNSRPPPKAPVPLSSDEMAIIKKKVAPPKGPPPAGFANFKAPKKYSSEDDENHSSHDRKGYADQYSDENGDSHKHTQGQAPRGDRYSNNRYRDDDDDDKKKYKSSPYQTGENIHEQPYRDDEEEDDFEDDHRRQQIKRVSKLTHVDDNHADQDDEEDENDDEYYHSSNRGSRDQHPAAHSSRAHSSYSHSPTQPSPTSPARLKIYNYKKMLRSSFKELKAFVTSPCELNTVVRCYIERNRSGSNYLTPVYSLCADLEDGTGRELISCRKFLKSKTSYYIFSLKSEDLYRKREQRGRYYLGKLRAMANDTYVLYDNGVCDTMARTGNGHSNGLNSDTVDEVTIGDVEDEDFDENGLPIKGSAHGGRGGEMAGGAYDHDESSLYRSQLAIIRYNTKHRPVEEGERGMEVCLPRVVSGSAGADSSQSGAIRHADMISSFEKIQKTGRQNELFANKFLILHEKRSRFTSSLPHFILFPTSLVLVALDRFPLPCYRYDPLSSCLVDFQGRATVASVKNFQLLVSTPKADTSRNAWSSSLEGRDDDSILQMGKVFPLSLFVVTVLIVSRLLTDHWRVLQHGLQVSVDNVPGLCHLSLKVSSPPPFFHSHSMFLSRSD